MHKVFRDTDLFNLEEQIYPRPNQYDWFYGVILVAAAASIGIMLAWRG